MTGVVDEEEMGGQGRTVRRKSMARSSVENVLTVLRNIMGLETADFDLHVNFPGGVPLDGPSAGVAIATAVYSAITKKPCDNRVAMTGELSIRGLVKPVGGVVAKVEAARQAGCKRILIPRDNWQEIFRHTDVEVIAVDTLQEVIDLAMVIAEPIATSSPVPQTDLLTASPSTAQ